MTLKKRYILLFAVLLVLLVNTYINKINLIGKIESPSLLNIYDINTFPSNIDPLKLSPEDLLHVSAEILDNNSFVKFKNLYEKDNVTRISKDEFFNQYKKSALKSKLKQQSNVRYMIISGFDNRRINIDLYQFGQGYIYDDGTFFQLFTKYGSSKKDIYVKGKLTVSDMNIINSIYNNAFKLKSNE